MVLENEASPLSETDDVRFLFRRCADPKSNRNDAKLILMLNCICTLCLGPPLQPCLAFFTEQCQLLQAGLETVLVLIRQGEVRHSLICEFCKYFLLLNLSVSSIAPFILFIYLPGSVLIFFPPFYPSPPVLLCMLIE